MGSRAAGLLFTERALFSIPKLILSPISASQAEPFLL